VINLDDIEYKNAHGEMVHNISLFCICDDYTMQKRGYPLYRLMSKIVEEQNIFLGELKKKFPQ
jgi:hypothetical protein